MSNLGIIDYKAGNSQSVLNALNHLSIPCKMVRNAEDMEGITHVVLPGVGSAKATMDSLGELDLIEPLTDWVMVQKRPFLGICIGHQIVFDYSDEDGVDCMGWVKGRVVRFDHTDLPVPQMGWNYVDLLHAYHSLAMNLMSHFFYFVNSYVVIPDNPDHVFAECEYGGRFCASILTENIFTTQFHIEKSGPAGLTMLENFSQWTP